MSIRSQRLARRSRSALLWSASLFVVLQSLTGLLLDYRYPFVRFPSAGTVLQDARQQPRTPTIVVLGSSRSGTAIDAPEMNRLLANELGQDAPWVFNASIPAGDTISYEFLFDHLLQQGTRPRWVVIEVMPEFLKQPNPWWQMHAQRQLNWEHVFSHTPDMLRSKAMWLYLQSRFVPLYTHRKQLILEGSSAVEEFLQTKPIPQVAFGPAPTARKTLDWNDLIRAPESTESASAVRERMESGRNEFRRWLRDYRIAGHSPAALERLLERCQLEQIGIVLFAVPACSVHREEMNTTIDTEFMNYINVICERFQCRFIDGRTWVPDALFIDPLHVRTTTGGLYFTRRFTEQVIRKLPPD